MGDSADTVRTQFVWVLGVPVRVTRGFGGRNVCLCVCSRGVMCSTVLHCYTAPESRLRARRYC